MHNIIIIYRKGYIRSFRKLACISCLTYSSTMKMEAIFSTETSVGFHGAPRHCNPNNAVYIQVFLDFFFRLHLGTCCSPHLHLEVLYNIYGTPAEFRVGEMRSLYIQIRLNGPTRGDLHAHETLQSYFLPFLNVWLILRVCLLITEDGKSYGKRPN
jgi:hypothetical protein